MTEYLVGTGGWAYFNLSKKPSLKVYSEIFNFTEVNHTFYEYPEPRVVERWRRTVPKDFTFAVRCHQDLTHRIGLRPVDEAYAVLGRMMTYCGILEAPFLVLETPQRYTFDARTVEVTRDFLSSANLKNVRLVWEVRATVTPELVDLMRDFKIVHSVDLSRQEQRLTNDIVYTRLFGKGKHNIYQFTDQELLEIDKRATKNAPKILAMAYHGLRMNT
ncbi:MAG TPA: DUF72 domain-containing protein, partial [Candidatus Bathyarchaeia archaeon]